MSASHGSNVLGEKRAARWALTASSTSCYSGPAGTDGVGICLAGTMTCNSDGTANGPCIGEVLPQLETCLTPEDDDCDGIANEEGEGC